MWGLRSGRGNLQTPADIKEIGSRKKEGRKGKKSDKKTMQEKEVFYKIVQLPILINISPIVGYQSKLSRDIEK